MSNLLDLKYKPVRPQGLTRTGYKQAPLHTNIKRSIPPRKNPMPLQLEAPSLVSEIPTKGEANAYTKDELLAPPESSSDDDDHAADIKPTNFRTVLKAKPTVQNSKTATRNVKTKSATANGSKSSRTQASKAEISSSSSSASGIKRKGQDDAWRAKGVAMGGKMVDAFGRVTAKKPKTGYSSQSRQKSNQPRPALKKAARLSSEASPPRSKKFVVPDVFDFDSPLESESTQHSPNKPAFSIPDAVLESPQKTTLPRSKFTAPDEIERSPQRPRTPTRKFTAPDKLDHTPFATPEVEKGFRNPGDVANQENLVTGSGDSLTDLDKHVESPTSSPLKLFQRPRTGFPKRDSKTLLELKKDQLGEELASRVGDIFGHNDDQVMADTSDLFDDGFNIPATVVARCPMCNQPCDADELKKWGPMDTRKQERFCRSHQKSTAEAKWSSKGYPKIDWDKLDSRISAHHEFIKDLLNGGECHYRRTFEDLVAAGKGRSLRKLESNLTPGYYGSRGLNVISEYVVHEFSRLLSKRSVADPLMSKRGTTAFLQSVIVPEVAVQLIREDMSIDDVRARDVLVESASVGELVHEEVKDVVEEMVEDSEDEDEDDE